MNILLACNGGISTGLIAEKMMELAKTLGKECTVWAVDDSQIENELIGNQVDIVLLGPQIKFKEKDIQASFSKYNIPIMCMNSMDYGMNDASRILKFAEKRIEEAKK